MYVEKLSDGRYKFIEKYKDPMTLKWKRVSVTTEKNDRRTSKIAEETLHQKINDALAVSDVSFLTFSELCEKYLAYQKQNVKPSTYERNRRFILTFVKIMEPNTLVNRLNARYIRECLDSTGNPNGTKNEQLKRLRALLRWGYQNDYIDDISYLGKLTNYTDHTRKEKLEDKFLEQDEINMLLSSMEKSRCHYWLDLTEFLLLTGLRVGEAIALKKSDIKDGYIEINKTYDVVNEILSNTPKTNSSNREISIQDELAEVIKRIKMHNKISKVSSTLLFSSPDGGYISYSGYLTFLEKHSKKALGRKITPHALRHTHASLLFANGISIDAVSRRLGHANSKVTREIYIHIMDKLKEKDKNDIQKLKLI